MSLEEYIPSEWVSEWGSTWAEKANEVSEKFKEQVKKASAWIARTRKDEKKAKKQDILLAHFLVQIILNKKYDILYDSMFKLIDEWVSSNFVLWVISLIYIDISHEIRKISNKKNIEFKYEKNVEIIEFDDDNLDKQIKDRINYWIEDINDILTIDYSSVMTKRLLLLIKNDDAVVFISKVFKFFLNDLNIHISKQKLTNISEFIIWEIYKNLQNLDIEKI